MADPISLAKFKLRIDNFVTSCHGSLPKDSHSWCSVIMNSILKAEIESGAIDKPTLTEVLAYAVKQSRLYVDPEQAAVEKAFDDVNVPPHKLKQAVKAVKEIVRSAPDKGYPTTGIKWMNQIKSGFFPKFKFSYQEEWIPPVANIVAAWYDNGMPDDSDDEEDKENSSPAKLLNGRRPGSDEKDRSRNIIQERKNKLIAGAWVACGSTQQHPLAPVQSVSYLIPHGVQASKKPLLACAPQESMYRTQATSSNPSDFQLLCLECSKVFKDDEAKVGKAVKLPGQHSTFKYTFSLRTVVFQIENEAIKLKMSHLRIADKEDAIEAIWKCFESSDIFQGRLPRMVIDNLRPPWSCPRCTFDNHPLLRACEQCETARPALTQTAEEEFPPPSAFRDERQMPSARSSMSESSIPPPPSDVAVETHSWAEVADNKFSSDEKIPDRSNADPVDGIMDFVSVAGSDEAQENPDSLVESIMSGFNPSQPSRPLRPSAKSYVPPYRRQSSQSSSPQRQPSQSSSPHRQPSQSSSQQRQSSQEYSQHRQPSQSSPQRRQPSQHRQPSQLFSQPSVPSHPPRSSHSPQNAIGRLENLSLNERKEFSGSQQSALSSQPSGGNGLAKPESGPEAVGNADNWRDEIMFGSRVDFQTARNGLAFGSWVPAMVIGMQAISDSFEVNVWFEAYPRNTNENVSINSGRIAKYLSHKHEYRIPPELDKVLIPRTSYRHMCKISGQPVEKQLSKEEEKKVQTYADRLNKHADQQRSEYEQLADCMLEGRLIEKKAKRNINRLFPDLAFGDDGQINGYRPRDVGPYTDLYKSEIPEEFCGTDRWNDDTLPTRCLYLYSICLSPKDPGFADQACHSFGFLVEGWIQNLPVIDVYPYTLGLQAEPKSFDAEVTLKSLGKVDLSPDQFISAKRAHATLYDKLTHARMHASLHMDFRRETFLVVPVAAGRIDWGAMDRLISLFGVTRAEFHANALPAQKYLALNDLNQAPVPLDNVLFGTKYDTSMGHSYVVRSVRSDMKVDDLCQELAPYDNCSFVEFFEKEHGIKILDRSQPLIECWKIHPRARSILLPRQSEPTAKSEIKFLPPELCYVYPQTKRESLEMTSIVPVMWGLQNAFTTQKLQQQVPVRIPMMLLTESLTASSVCATMNYELLEFLGDGILKFVATDYLYIKFPFKDEGELTTMRSKLIQNETLSTYALAKSIPSYAIVTKFERKSHLPPCFNQAMKMKRRLDHKEMSQKRLADMVEAILGAAFKCGSGFEGVLDMLKWFGSEIRMEEYSHCEADGHTALMNKINVSELEAKLKYKFRRPIYAYEALSIAGSVSEHVRRAQQLELLGDSVLDVLVTRKLCRAMPGGNPGTLTDGRRDVVCNDALAEMAARMGLVELFINPKPIVADTINDFFKLRKVRRDATPQSVFQIEGPGLPKKNAPRTRLAGELKSYPKLIGDLVEAIIGAVYLDSGRSLEAVWKVFGEHMALPKYEDALALDCEFVGIGPDGHHNQLARVSIVDSKGVEFFDSHVAQIYPVVDWRTEVSGIRPKDVENAPSFNDIQLAVARMIEGKMLIGHNIESDLKVLWLSHPPYLIRDTCTFRKLCPGGPISLRTLCKKHLDMDIQGGEHSSIEDARATLFLYKKFMAEELGDLRDKNEELAKFDVLARKKTQV
eukprot:122993_1